MPTISRRVVDVIRLDVDQPHASIVSWPLLRNERRYRYIAFNPPGADTAGYSLDLRLALDRHDGPIDREA
jgi:hypothetical protein